MLVIVQTQLFINYSLQQKYYSIGLRPIHLSWSEISLRLRKTLEKIIKQINFQICSY